MAGSTNDLPEARIALPSWFGGGNLMKFLADAKLYGVRIRNTDQWLIRTAENQARRPPSLVTQEQTDTPDQARKLIAERVANLPDLAPHSVAPAEVQRRVERAERTKDPVDILWARHLQTLTYPAAQLPDLVAGVLTELQSQLSQNARVHVVRRGEEVLRRGSLTHAMLRVQHDPQLAAQQLQAMQVANKSGQLVFSSSRHLAQGMYLLDAYLGPLLGALTPSAWAIASHRQRGTIIYTYGQPLAGTRGDAAELLHILPVQGDPNPFQVPELSADASSAAVDWWIGRLNALLGVMTDPAVFTNRNGDYDPMKHLQSRMTVEQLFRRVTSIQAAYRDVNARRVLLFTVLDTLERLTGGSINDLCSLRLVRKKLDELRANIPAGAAEVLLPAAERAVVALKQVQDGFFLGHQPGGTRVDLTHQDGTVEVLDAGVAAADYIKVLRDATHGHGADKAGRMEHTNLLLTHHDGSVPPDLSLLGYLHLIYIMTKIDNLKGRLSRS